MRPYATASASVLSGGNGWDTSAVLYAAAEAAEAGRCDPVLYACTVGADNGEEVDTDLVDFALDLATECIRRWGGEWMTSAESRARACRRAAASLDAALAAEVRP